MGEYTRVHPRPVSEYSPRPPYALQACGTTLRVNDQLVGTVRTIVMPRNTGIEAKVHPPWLTLSSVNGGFIMFSARLAAHGLRRSSWHVAAVRQDDSPTWLLMGTHTSWG